MASRHAGTRTVEYSARDTTHGMGYETMIPITKKVGLRSLFDFGSAICGPVLWLLVLYAGGPSSSRAEPPTDVCAKPTVTFDGTNALTYAVVTANVGVDARLHANPFAECRNRNGSACDATQKLMPGDDVAIGASCGDWDYVQYIGSEDVKTGWIADGELAKKTLLPKEAPVKRADNHWAFRLTEGKGTPVCEAYLQRINSGPSDRSPYCGFSDETQVPGFGRLERVWMDWADIQNIDDDLAQFVGQGTISPSHRRTPILFKDAPAVYRFAGGVDIENVGRSDDVLMWNFESRAAPTCGQSFGADSVIDKHGWVGVILTPDGKDIDADRTRRVFGSRAGGLYLTSGNPPSRTFVPSYGPIGLGYNLFQFHGVYYYSTFLSTFYDFDGDRSPAKDNEDTLGVFVVKSGVTRKVCEFRLPANN